VKLVLRDRSLPLIEAWKKAFEGVPDVQIEHNLIFADPLADAVVSPANSQGFMDGGIDFVYTLRFGWALQTRLKALILSRHENGKLPIGEALVVKTFDPALPYCISSPTMETPGVLIEGTQNAYLAFKAALLAIRYHNIFGDEREIKSILCPGMGTGVGKMDPTDCANQMRKAWNEVQF
jgi:O-acetyl-ADP-ribose deacetylase (regulator of RNase III)